MDKRLIDKYSIGSRVVVSGPLAPDMPSGTVSRHLLFGVIIDIDPENSTYFSWEYLASERSRKS